MADDLTPPGKAERSAAIATTTLESYAVSTGTWVPTSPGEDQQTLISDLLADLMHLCAAHDALDFDEALRVARMHHQAET